MTNIPQWGDPIPANGKRPEWLRDDEEIKTTGGSATLHDTFRVRDLVVWEHPSFAFRLPANHWVYPSLPRVSRLGPGRWAT